MCRIPAYPLKGEGNISILDVINPKSWIENEKRLDNVPLLVRVHVLLDYCKNGLSLESSSMITHTEYVETEVSPTLEVTIMVSIPRDSLFLSIAVLSLHVCR